MRKIHRFEVPVDDQTHVLRFPIDSIKHVAARDPYFVEVWAEVNPGRDVQRTVVQVYGTGQPIPDNVEHIGSAITPSGTFVWHLYGSRA